MITVINPSRPVIITKLQVRNTVLTLKTAAASGRVTSINVGKTGQSAYELAVENGFVGTVQEWLTTLGTDDEDLGDNPMIADPLAYYILAKN